MPERSGGPVRARAGTVDREEGAGVREGSARDVGYRGLKMAADVELVLSPYRGGRMIPSQVPNKCAVASKSERRDRM